MQLVHRGGSSFREISISAYTTGEPIQVYSASPDTSLEVDINIEKSLFDGILVYRRLSTETEFTFVGSSSKLDPDDDTLYWYLDRLPDLVDGGLYVYKFQYYFYNDDTIDGEIETTGDSAEIQVPILPRYGLSLVAPANNSVLNSAPASIDFSWQPNYDTTAFDSLEVGAFARKDTLFVLEVGTMSLMRAVDVTAANPLSSNGGTNVVTSTWNTGDLSTAIAGKHLFWTVTGELRYDYEGTNYEVTSISRPTVSGYTANPVFLGAAQNGSFFFTVE